MGLHVFAVCAAKTLFAFLSTPLRVLRRQTSLAGAGGATLRSILRYDFPFPAIALASRRREHESPPDKEENGGDRRVHGNRKIKIRKQENPNLPSLCELRQAQPVGVAYVFRQSSRQRRPAGQGRAVSCLTFRQGFGRQALALQTTYTISPNWRAIPPRAG